VRIVSRIYKHLLVEAANRFFSSVALSAMVAPALRLFGASVGTNAHIYSPLILHNTVFSNLAIGENCHIGRCVFLDLEDRIEVGDNVSISMNVSIITHLDMGRSPLSLSVFPAEKGPVRIGSGTFIGAGVTVLHGVTIGENCVVAAGSVVRTDVSTSSVVAGVPARFVRELDVASWT
jgi:acetyltransferase-like isoleucine patch superfamily enzyme